MPNTIRTQKTDANGVPVFVTRDVVRTVSGGEVLRTQVQAPDMPVAGPHLAISNDIKAPAVTPAPSKEMDALAARVTDFLAAHHASREAVPQWQKSVDGLQLAGLKDFNTQANKAASFDLTLDGIRDQATKLNVATAESAETQLAQLATQRSKTNGVA